MNLLNKIQRLMVAVCLLLPCSTYAENTYQPTPENIKARQEFAHNKFGIFLHWGIYSTFAQGEWYMTNAGINHNEYAKVASSFYPSKLTPMHGSRLSKKQVQNISVLPLVIMTVSQCSIHNTRHTTS